MNSCCIIIPAIKKNVAFTDDLVKKLAGISLIQRAIDKAKELVSADRIRVITDSDEISLICQRNKVNYIYDAGFYLDPHIMLGGIYNLLPQIAAEFDDILLLSPYAPLVKTQDVLNGYMEYKKNGNMVLVPVRRQGRHLFKKKNRSLQRLFSAADKEEVFLESKAFLIFRASLVNEKGVMRQTEPTSYELTDDSPEINNYQDWWVCEKLLNRKRIIFRVIGNEIVGMGHIFRALSLAHEITDHEIRFVCDEQSRVAANKLAGYDYWLATYPANKLTDEIIKLQPDLVINDILDTSREYVLMLKDKGIKVVNFEDIGPGAVLADLTINELFNEPVLSGENIHWGYKYFFVRDEFDDARPHRFTDRIDNVLITFGGTDQNDFTKKILQAIHPFCRESGIRIYIVTGDGYPHKKILREILKEQNYSNVEFTHATGVISSIMEKTQVAVTSNGRTVYELAHMNIPAIVLSHHPRERTHLFSIEAHGFINLGLYDPGLTEEKVLAAFKRLVNDTAYRKSLFTRMKPFRFNKNKTRVVKLLMQQLETTGP